MRVVDLSGTWRFTPADAGAAGPVRVPGFLEGPAADGLCERDFDLDGPPRGATLEFDAVAEACTVLVNGDRAGSHETGFTPFTLDVAHLLRAGTNTIAVDVSGSGSAAGIWRPCRLVLHDGAYVEDLWCDLDPDEPLVGVSVRGADEATVEAFGSSVAVGATVRMPARGAARWSPSSPVLHDVRAQAGGHERVLRAGLRRLLRVGDELEIDGIPYRMRAALHRGAWPAEPAAGLMDVDMRVARDAGLNTFRMQGTAFGPAWLDAADAAGMLLHCDIPTGGEDPAAERCVTAASELVRRDRSHASIVLWSLGGRRDVVPAMHDALRELDPSRPVASGRGEWERERLIVSDVRTPNWAGRASSRAVSELDERLDRASHEDGPLYVTASCEWGLPAGAAAAAATEAGWTGSSGQLADATQRHQGWTARIHAERLRASQTVLGVCVADWTDVPPDLCGLVALDRTPKPAAIDALRPALADVAVIAILDRYAFAKDEAVEVRVVVSNWSPQDLPPGTLTVRLTGKQAKIETPSIGSGWCWPAGRCRLAATSAGRHELIAKLGEHESRLPVVVTDAAEPRAVAVHGGPLPAELDDAGWTQDPEGVALVLAGPAPAGPAVLLGAGRDSLEPVPQGPGPTPWIFRDDATLLSEEVYHCYPRWMLPGVRGPVGIVIPEPDGRWGSVVAVRDGHVSCLLELDPANGWDRTVLAWLVDLAAA